MVKIALYLCLLPPNLGLTMKKKKSQLKDSKK